MLGKESCSVMTIEWMEGLALFSALLDDNRVFWGETFAAMLIGHSTAYQCFQCGDRRWGFFDPIFFTSLKVVALSICCPSIFSARFWNAIWIKSWMHLEMCSSRWLRNHELVGSATTTSQSFKPTSWLGGFRGGVISPSFFTEESDSFKIQNDSSFAELQPFEDPEVVQKVVFPCPCGPWGGQVGDMIDLLYDLFLIWRRPISTGFIRRLAVAQIALVGILFAFDSFDFSDGLKLLDWLAPYWSNYVCLKCAVARERCLGGRF